MSSSESITAPFADERIMKLSRTEASVLNLLFRCSKRIGQEIMGDTDWSIELDLWYNYCDIPLNNSLIAETLTKLANLGYVELSETEGGYSLTELGKYLNETLTNQAEADETRQWEDSPFCKEARKGMYGRQMQILTGRAAPIDVPLFNMLSDEHAEKINQAIEIQIKRTAEAGEALTVMDFGCGVISRFPELLMQRSDTHSANYLFIEEDEGSISRLKEKHGSNPQVGIVKSNYRALAHTEMGKFRLILAIDVLYFIQKFDDRAFAIRVLFDKLAQGGMLIFNMGAAPLFSLEDSIAIGKELPLNHPRSGLSEIMSMLREEPSAKVEILSESYWNSWQRFASVFTLLPKTTDPALERVRFEINQALTKQAKNPESPSHRTTFIIEKTECTR